MSDATGRPALVCLSGLSVPEFLERSFEHLNPAVPVVLLYVMDTRPLEHLEHVGRRLHPGPRGAPGHGERMQIADEATAGEVLAEGEAECARLGRQVTRALALRGHPEREIVAAALELGAGLVVVGASHRGGAKPKHGPASVGKVARYVLDHSPCPVLLIR